MTNPTTKKLTTSIDNFKRTKIYASIGPATDSYELVYAMLKEGVNAINMNFSHGTYEERKRQLKWIRRASSEFGKPVAVIQDLQGPKIRLGDFEGFRHRGRLVDRRSRRLATQSSASRSDNPA